MKLKEALGVVPIDEAIMAIVYNNGNVEKFVGNSIELEYQWLSISLGRCSTSTLKMIF